jgi:hypothetical protein
MGEYQCPKVTGREGSMGICSVTKEESVGALMNEISNIVGKKLSLAKWLDSEKLGVGRLI